MAMAGPTLHEEGRMPALDGATGWLNSEPLTAHGLHGRVVLIDFWTYTCINWLRTLPYVRAWAEEYRAQGLVVLGVHTPEFTFEQDVGNVRRAVETRGITYPVALERELRRVHPEDDESVVPVRLGPGPHVGQCAQPVDAGVGPELDEDGFSAE